MFSPRLLAVIASSFIFLFLGAFLNSPILTLLAFAVLCVPLVSFFDFYLSTGSLRSLILERKLLKTRVVRGGYVGVKVEVSNSGRSSLKITVRDSFSPNRLRLVYGNNLMSFRINPREKVAFSYFLRTMEEGVAHIGPAIVSIQDFLGLFRSIKVFKELDRILVLPPVREVEESVIEYSSPRDFKSIGEHTSKSVGISTEYASSREYVPGDDLRYVDWKATARTGKLIVKEFESQTSSSYLLLVDCGKSMSEGWKTRKIDYLKQAVVILAREAIKRGDEVGLLIPSASGVASLIGTKRYLPPSPGTDQFYSILELTSLIQARGTPDFLKSVKFIEKRIRPPLSLFLITDLEDFKEKRIYDAVERAISAGYDVTVISPYTPLFLEPQKILGEGDVFQLVVGMDIMEEDRKIRSEIIGKLQELGVRVIEVGPADFFPIVLTEYHLTKAKPKG
ncbi:MAG: hypothetical protein DRO00_03155 [Thermoproteota archaeon]|nr:MAG: hypothetical protein DRO00_03155 [Candidatus Korarchaeota archaeon]